MILDCGHHDNGDLCTVHERDCTFHGQGVCVCPTVCPACCPECTPNQPQPVSCWEDRSSFYMDPDSVPGSCLLPDGHDGPHEFTDDSAIRLRFV